MSFDTPAAGIRVLLVEDEPIVAVLVESLLDSIGCIVAATAASIAQAIAAIETHEFDVAMIDVNLGGEDGLVVADLLKAREIPYLITTGYDALDGAQGHADAPLLAKPYAITELENTLCRVTGRL